MFCNSRLSLSLYLSLSFVILRFLMPTAIILLTHSNPIARVPVQQRAVFFNRQVFIAKRAINDHSCNKWLFYSLRIDNVKIISCSLILFLLRTRMCLLFCRLQGDASVVFVLRGIIKFSDNAPAVIAFIIVVAIARVITDGLDETTAHFAAFHHKLSVSRLKQSRQQHQHQTPVMSPCRQLTHARNSDHVPGFCIRKKET